MNKVVRTWPGVGRARAGRVMAIHTYPVHLTYGCDMEIFWDGKLYPVVELMPTTCYEHVLLQADAQRKRQEQEQARNAMFLKDNLEWAKAKVLELEAELAKD